ncbi:unnamed protein product [Durusdinium trenchii]|uniref:Uncharacterized protein n=2 Tax=Durusdinium trenchii TaxID=1381693 RepID=A0ABP0K637_9DINO
MAVMQQNVSAALVMMACGAAPIWLHDAVRVGAGVERWCSTVPKRAPPFRLG